VSEQGTNVEQHCTVRGVNFDIWFRRIALWWSVCVCVCVREEGVYFVVRTKKIA
jgi:hypothetical protein